MRRHLGIYVAMLVVFGSGIGLALLIGTRLPPASGSPAPPGALVAPVPASAPLLENLRQPLAVLLLQLVVVVGAARVLGGLFRRLGQPSVIGEIVAGILLGPSLLGLLLPGTERFLFPEASMPSLRVLSQVGVILFMFVVGIDLDLEHLRRKAHTAILVSHASILVPFFLGTAFSLWIYAAYAPGHISFLAFALFMGTAMSITAFPVLARILEERGLSRSQLGSTAIACAAVDDVTAWCMLAAVVAIVRSAGLAGAGLTVGLTLAFIGLMLGGVKPLVARLLRGRGTGEARAGASVAGILLLVCGAALVTELIGIHALFGAFLAGVVIPAEPGLRALLRERLETFSSVFLLPLFFAFTGLRTQLGLLSDLSSWLVCAAIVAVAIAGKLGGTAFAARWTGMSWRHACALGVLMNTRGLVELIVLNIGYDLGILPPRLFAMMVLMALATTFMTGPLLSLLEEGQLPFSMREVQTAAPNEAGRPRIGKR